jgi:hypothetical protein
MAARRSGTVGKRSEEIGWHQATNFDRKENQAMTNNKL